MTESRKKRILIVDNDEEESGRLGGMLQRAGYDSSATWSGLEALKLLKSEKYDILLPVRPCSIVMQEGCTPAAALQEMKNMAGEEKLQAR